MDHWWPSRETPSGPLITCRHPDIHSYCLPPLVVFSPHRSLSVLFPQRSLPLVGLSDLGREECSSGQVLYVKTFQGLRWEECGASGWEGFVTDWQVQVKVDWVNLMSLGTHTRRLQPGYAYMGKRAEVRYGCDGVSNKGKLQLSDADVPCSWRMNICLQRGLQVFLCCICF